MVQHVRVWDERAGSETSDIEPEITAAHTHARPLELLQRRHVPEGRIELADDTVVPLDRLVSLLYLNGGAGGHRFILEGRGLGWGAGLSGKKRRRRRKNTTYCCTCTPLARKHLPRKRGKPYYCRVTGTKIVPRTDIT